VSPTQSSKDFTIICVESRSRALAGDRVRAVCGSRLRSTVRGSVVGLGPAQASLSAATARAGRAPAIGCSVGACGTERKPLASLGLGLTAALRVRSVRAGGAGSCLVSHTTRPERAKEDRMNRWTGTGHLTQDPKLVETDGGTAICTLRIAVQRAGKKGHDGYFDVKCFDGQAHACADYLKAGREVAIDGRLLFDEFQTQDGAYASRVYIVAERVEFLDSRNTRANGQAGSEASPEQPATDGAAQEPNPAA
jgi:single-strand DNA-binding protein